MLPDEFRAAAADLLRVSEPNASAELIADRGEAAAGDEFFRSRPFLDAEGVTHTLRIAGRRRRAARPADRPRDRDGPERDAISPYGYPGSSSAASDIDRTEAGSSRLRRRPGGDRLLRDRPRHASSSATARRPPPLTGATERYVVQSPTRRCRRRAGRATASRSAEPAPRATRCSSSPGPRPRAEQRAGFLAAYEQTMRRADAAEHYFFGAAYFDRILALRRTWLALAAPPAAISPPPRSPSAATASSTTTSAAPPTPTCATRR